MNTDPSITPELRDALTVITSYMETVGIESMEIHRKEEGKVEMRKANETAIQQRIVGLVEELYLGEKFTPTVERLTAAAAVQHSRGVSYFLPDGDGQTPIKPGAKFPAHGYIQHSTDGIWALSKFVDRFTNQQACGSVRERLLCIDRYGREYSSPRVAAQDSKKGFVCLELRPAAHNGF